MEGRGFRHRNRALPLNSRCGVERPGSARCGADFSAPAKPTRRILVVMARAAKNEKPKSAKRHVSPKLIKLTLNPAHLTEDEADYLCWLKRKHEKRVPLEEVMKKAGLRADR